ncbi:hypothetical protein O6H91_14G003400 [Diphasiastrum complanatum]|nr:hypothetical protein O6H91_14G003400 [Diphasiastrum complanatum]
MGSDSGSADCSSLDSMRSCCFYCKEPRGRNRRNFPIERKFARFSVESLEDRPWDSLSTEPEIPFASMKEKKISVKEGSPKRYRNIDKPTKGSTFNGKLDVTGEAGGLFEQHIYWTRLQQGENIERNTFYGSKVSEEVEAHPLEFHTNSFTTSDLVVKYDTTLKGSTSKKDRENETRLHHVDAKSKVLTRASEHENRMQILQKAIKVEREAVDTFYKELEGHLNASVLAASETLARIDDLQEEKTAVQIEASEKIELCRHILLDDRVRQWRRQKLKREEFENCYKTGRMSSAKWSEKPVLVPEAREKTHSIGGSELKIGVKDYGRDSIGIVDTRSDNLTEEVSKIKSFKKIEAPNTEKTMKVKKFRRQMNSLPQTKTTNPEANTLRIPPKVEREKLPRKLLLVPERSNDAALESGTAKEEERTTESGDMEDGQYYESSDSIYPVKQQHIGKKLLRPLFDFPDNSQWASRVRDKKESCSEIDYSEDDASVLGFYFETEGDECWSDSEDLLNDKTDGPTDSATENTDECITIEMDSTVTMHQDDEKIKKVVGVGLNFIC